MWEGVLGIYECGGRLHSLYLYDTSKRYIDIWMYCHGALNGRMFYFVLPTTNNDSWGGVDTLIQDKGLQSSHEILIMFTGHVFGFAGYALVY